ncbi:MAG: hypothetical protein OXD29_07230, partial [Roseovarius sp.]|nr:hypothetical protein [Roseovarius sp.]
HARHWTLKALAGEIGGMDATTVRNILRRQKPVAMLEFATRDLLDPVPFELGGTRRAAGNPGPDAGRASTPPTAAFRLGA